MPTNPKTGVYTHPGSDHAAGDSEMGQHGAGVVGTHFDGYMGGLSQCVNNEEVAAYVRVDVVSPQSDNNVDNVYNPDKATPGYPADSDGEPDSVFNGL